MSAKKEKTFNSQVFDLSIKKLQLKRREKIIFFRLLGFLIRNDKPFPYSSNSMAELTGYSRSSVFECFNLLERYRLIERIGYTNRTKFIKGSILKRICTLVQKRINNNLYNKSTLVQKLDELSLTSPETGYQRTSSFLKHKKGVSYKPEVLEFQELQYYLDNPQFKMPENLHIVLEWVNKNRKKQ